MQVEISFKNKSKLITIHHLKSIEYLQNDIFDIPFEDDEKSLVTITDNFTDFRLRNVRDDVTFIGDETFTVIVSSIESVRFMKDED